MEPLKSGLQDSFDSATGRGGSDPVSFNLHDALTQRAENNQIPEIWQQNPEGYKREFVNAAKQHMQSQSDMHWQEGKDFGPDQQQKIINNLPDDPEALQVETYYLNRDLQPAAQGRQMVMERTRGELGVAAWYEDETRAGKEMDDPVMAQSRADNIIERAAVNGLKYGFDPAEHYENMTGTPLPENTRAQLEMNMMAESDLRGTDRSLNNPAKNIM